MACGGNRVCCSGESDLKTMIRKTAACNRAAYMAKETDYDESKRDCSSVQCRGLS